MFAEAASNNLKACRSKVRLGTRLVALGLLVLLVQAMLWVEQGYWTPFDIENIARFLGFRIPAIGWQSAQAVVDWLVVFPLSALPVGFGFSLAWSGAARADLSQLSNDRR